MANPQAVRALLKDLKRVGSPVQRVKLLALAWRTVRELSPDERSEIASELGMSELSGLMERLGRKKDGVAPAEVLQALEQVDELDPKKVSTVLRGLWAPGTRKKAVHDGLEMLGRIFDEPEPEVDKDADEVSPEADPAVIELEPLVVEPEAVEEPAAEPDASQAMPAVAETPEVEPVEPPTPEPERAPEPPVAIDERASDPLPIPPPLPAPERSSEKAPAPPTGATVATLASAPSASKRFRIVRELLTGGAGVDEGSLEAVAEQFPDGWQRRRVLCMLFRNGRPASTGRALDMIAALERPVDRRWCASTLADTRDLSPAEIDDLLRRFPFRGLDRRLRRVRRTD